jgi:predicted permease
MNRHSLDSISLITGIVFAGLGIAFLTGTLSVVDVRGDWLVPIVLVALGAALAVSAVGYIAREQQQPETASEEDASPPAREL